MPKVGAEWAVRCVGQLRREVWQGDVHSHHFGCMVIAEPVQKRVQREKGEVLDRALRNPDVGAQKGRMSLH